MSERDAFLAAIAAAPEDEAPHRVFADWLDEHGEHEEAAYHRRWTVEVARAEAWLAAYAAELNELGAEAVADFAEECAEDFGEEFGESAGYEFTMADLIRAAHAYLRTGETYCLPFDTPDRVWEDREAFWKNFEIATGTPVPDGQREATFFRCAC